MAILKSTRDVASVDEAGKVVIASVAEGLAGTNATKVMTPAATKAVIDALIDGAPGALDTLNELAAAINDDANFVTTVNSSLTNLQNQINSVSGGGATNQIELDNTQAGAGLGTDGSYTAHSGSNFISSVSTLHAADLALDTQIQVNATAIASLGSGNLANLQTEVDSIESGVGLSSTGTYVGRSGTNYLDSASSIVGELTALDTQAKANEDAIALLGNGSFSALQAEVDAIEASAGLNSNGTITYSSTPSNFSASASLKAAVEALDSEVSSNAGDIASNLSSIGTLNSLQTAQEAAIGLSTSGTYVSRSSTNFLDSASSIAGEITALDTQLGTTQSDLDTAEASIASQDTNITAIEASVGLSSNGTKTNYATTNFISNSDSIKAAIEALDAQVKTNETDITGISGGALLTEINAIESGVGLNSDGSYTAIVSANYATSSTLKGAVDQLDVQLKTTQDDLETAEASIATKAASSTVTALSSTVDTVEASVGLTTSGGFTANSGGNFIASASSVRGEINALDTQVATNQGDISNLSSSVNSLTSSGSANSSEITNLENELDATQAGAGLGTTGAYAADSSTNYITGATTLKGADVLLDTQIKSNETAIALRATTSTVNSISSDVTSNTGSISTNASNISTNTSSISTNASNIASNTSDISSINSGKASTSSVAALQSEVDTTQASIGLSSAGAYVSPGGHNFLGQSTLKADLGELDDQVKVNTDAIALRATSSTVTALQSEVDATQTGAGLTSAGAYTANSGSNYITSASTLKAADDLLDAQIKTNETAIATKAASSTVTALQSEVNTTQAGAGLASNGDFVNYSGSNYLDSTSTLAAAIEALDTQLGTTQGEVDAEETARASADSTLTAAIDTVEASVGLQANGSLSISGTNFLNSSSTIVGALSTLDTNQNLLSGIRTNMIASLGLSTTGEKNNYANTNFISNSEDVIEAIEALDRQVNTNATDITSISGGSISALQTEVNSIETAAGLNTNGTYVAHSGSNYMDSASTMKAAREALDTQVKTNETAIATKANSTTLSALDLRVTQIELSGGGLWTDDASNDEVSYEFRLEHFRSHIGPWEVKLGGIGGFIMNGAGSDTTDLIMYETKAERDGDKHFHVHPTSGDLIFQGKGS